MKNYYKIKYSIIAGLLVLLTQNVHAENIEGTISKGDSSVRYKVNTNTGEYTLDLKNAFNVKILINDKDLNSVSCRDEEALLRGTNGGNAMHDFIRSTVRLGFQVSDLSLEEIETKISSDLARKGKSVSKLKRTTEFYLGTPDLNFEWESSSLTYKAKSKFTEFIQEKFRKFINYRDARINLHNMNTAYMEMPIHLVVCDLLKKDLVIKWNSNVEVENEGKKDPPLTKNQLSSLNNYLLKNIDKLENSSTDNIGMSLDSKKIVNSSGLLAFGLAKQGVDSSFIGSRYFESIYFRIFGFPSRLPKKLSESEIEDMQRSITDDVSTLVDTVHISKAIKVEILK